jgi:hypothetical protein
MKQSVNTLNTAMDKLNKETVKITQQNALNAKSSSGVYLLPGRIRPRPAEQPDWHAKNVSGECGGECRWYSRNITHQGESNDPLPALQRHRRVGPDPGHHGELPGGEREESALHRPGQCFSSDVDIPLQLSGLTPEQLGFIRIHDIQPAAQ